MFAYVGEWNFNLIDGKYDRGISCYHYSPDSGDLELIETVDRDVAAGQFCLDRENGILYVVYEVAHRRGELGGGGYIRAYRINKENGKLTLLNEIESLLANPAYVCMDKDKKYLIVCHHTDPFHVNKLVCREDGTYDNEVIMDDAALLLIKIREDHSIGDIVDAYITPSNVKLREDSKIMIDPVTKHIQLTRVISRQHAVVPDPTGTLFAVMDKGMDRVHMFKIDENKEKLVLMDCYPDELGVFPRYGSYHPILPILYTNNERVCEIHAFSYHRETGKLSLLQKVNLLLPEYQGKQYSVKTRPMGAQDILMHPDGKTLYCTLEGGDHLIVALSVAEDGTLTVMQNIDCAGKMPRGICLSPDGRFLLCGNNLSGDVTTFEIAEDGLLAYTGKAFPAVSPSALCIYEGI